MKQDAVGQIFNGVPSINTNEIQTSVLVGNGETLVLGGILQEDANSSERKTPILSDIPFLEKLSDARLNAKTSRSFWCLLRLPWYRSFNRITHGRPLKQT